VKFYAIIEPNLPGQCKKDPRHPVQTPEWKTGFFDFYSGACERPKKGLNLNVVQDRANHGGLFREVPMLESRRHLLMTIAGAAGVLAVIPVAAAWPQSPGSRPLPQPRPSPNAPNPNVPAGIDGQLAKAPDERAIARANQQELKADVSKLYEMVTELKEQIEKTDASSMLSVPVVKKAQQIESLAKQIKNLAKG
jgi:hypothetical protein